MQVESLLRSMGFTYPAAPSKRPPAERAEELRQRIAKAKENSARAEAEIAELKDSREALLYTAGLLRYAGR